MFLIEACIIIWVISHEINLFCLPGQERFFHTFRVKTALNTGKYLQNRSRNGYGGCVSSCCFALKEVKDRILSGFLCFAKKSAKL